MGPPRQAAGALREPIVSSGFLKDAHFWTFEEFVLDSLLRNYIPPRHPDCPFSRWENKDLRKWRPCGCHPLPGPYGALGAGPRSRPQAGELYMDGRLTIEQGDIVALMDLLVCNVTMSGISGSHRALRFLRQLFRAFGQFNPGSRARAHVAHHYDLSRQLYDLFLDATGNIPVPISPRRATRGRGAGQKKQHIAAKLNLNRPGLKVLDIGCGWGGLALDLRANAAPMSGRHIVRPSRSPWPRARRGRRASTKRAIPADGLPRGERTIRPHRLGRHVRACRRRLLLRFLRQGARTSGR